MKKASEMISKIATLARNEPFKVSPDVPFGYLVGFLFGRVLDYIRGLIKFRQPSKYIFLGKNASIKCLSKVRVNRLLKLSSESYVDALSVEGVIFGNNFSLGRCASIECTGSLANLGRGFVSGDNVGIGSFSFIGCAGGVSIGSNTIIGNYVSMHSENHNFDRLDIPIRLQGVSHSGIRIGENCWIGAKVTILDGANIGNNVIIAAGAVVSAGDYDGDSIYGGVPARKIKSLK